MDSLGGGGVCVSFFIVAFIKTPSSLLLSHTHLCSLQFMLAKAFLTEEINKNQHLTERDKNRDTCRETYVSMQVGNTR